MAMDFWTQRVTQPDSRDDSDLEVKSSMQDMKQWSTRLPNSCGTGGNGQYGCVLRRDSCVRARGECETYADELLDLALLHALLELPLLRGIESTEAACPLAPGFLVMGGINC